MVEILIRYLGIKTKLLKFIRDEINRITSPDEGVLDLFAGSNSVAQFLLQDHPIFTNDYQKYSETVSKALIEFHDKKIVDSLSVEKVFGAYYLNNKNKLLEIFEKPLTFEREILNKIGTDYKGSNFEDFIDFFNNSPYVGHIDNKHKSFADCLSYFDEKNIKSYRDNNNKFPYLLFSTFFNNPYFSLLQCVEIDSIKYSIDTLFTKNEISEAEYNIYISFLIYTLNLIVISVGDHFAQPQKIKELSPDSSNPRDKIYLRERKKIITKKKIDITELFNEKLVEFKNNYKAGNKNNKAFSMNALDLLQSNLLDNLMIKTVYIDPPYTNAHYSRFYHIPETLTLYDYPKIEFFGRYRTDRYQSNFCIKTQAYGEFKTMLELCNNKHMNTVISYSNTEQCILKIDDLIQICNSAYGNENVTINNIEHLYRNFGQKPNKIFAKEYLITCIAR